MIARSRRPAQHLSRRRGQALLLAVLLMVFAALLGATMVTLVSSNLSQTSRQGGLAAASTASTGALAFLNDRLTNSLEGERWRPWQGSPPPSPGDSDFSLYYSAYERAQGWVNQIDFRPLNNADANDRNANGISYAQAVARGDKREMDAEFFEHIEAQARAGARCFVKFPDPRGASTNANGPQYLAEVVTQPDGLLRLIIIGQSEDEPGAFSIRTAFKPTLARGGPFSFSRFDSNYSYRNKALARTRLSAPAASAVLQVESTVGLEAGRTIIIGDDAATAQVATVAGAAPNTLTLTAPVTAPAGASVTASSPLMDGIRSQDFDADAAPDNVKGDTNDWEATLAPLRRAARGVMINGGATLEGKSTLTLGGSNTSATDDDDTLSVAGLIARPAAPSDQAMLSTPDAIPTLAPLPASNDTRSDPLQLLVRDNRGPESSHIRALTPPTIDGPSSRYRELTQFADVLSGSPDGYGPGVYIDNGSDVEKKTAGTLREVLPIFESQRLFARKYLPYGPPVASGTLEERHIRGWVSPWEFRARGVLIELRGDQIVFTRDDRSDATVGPLLNQPDPAKAWKQPGGAALAAPGANTFRMVLDITNGNRYFGAPGAEVGPFPGPAFNGLIFAEGNVRVRGFLGSRDITIASMGSIFIEGSLVRDRSNPTAPAATARRLALLARRNVVLNPTQWPAPLSGAQDRDVAAAPALLSAAATAGNTTITVGSPDALRVGDEVRVGSELEWHMVTQISGTQVTLATGLGADAAPNDPVRPLSDPGLSTAGSETFYDLGADNGGAFARDVRLDGVAPASTYALSWLHAGGRAEALQFKRTGGGAGSFNAKENTTASTPEVISGSSTNEKTFTASGGASQDLLDINANGMQEGDGVETLQELKNRFDDPNNSLLDNPNWEVNLATGQGGVAARRLAAIGSGVGAGDDPAIAQGDSHSVPLALGGGWFFQPAWNSNAASLVPPPVGGVAPVPWQAIGTSDTPGGDDDLETTREDFYQRGPGASPTQAPLRWRSAALPMAPDALEPNVATFLHDPGFSAGTGPAYHLGQFKIERDDFAAASGAFDAVPLYVQATIFAQEGSWFVVTPPLNAVPDANNDGDTTDAEDVAAATRYRRLNYQVTVTGTIAQNFAPTAMLDYDGTLGLMRGWIDALSHPANVEDNGSGQGRGRDWQSIEYQPDAVPPNSGLYLPPTPDLLYTS